MDGLAVLAKRSIQDLEITGKFRPSSKKCAIIELQANSQNQPHVETELSEPELIAKLQQWETPSPGFKLACVLREEDETIRLSPRALLHIFGQLRLDPAALYLISRNSYGFHQFARTRPANSHTFFLGTIMYAFIWSWDEQTSSTTSLLLLRRGTGLKTGIETFNEFLDILQIYSSHSSRPWFLAFILGLQTLRFVDDNIQQQLEHIRNVEAEIGYGYWTSGKRNHRADVEDLTKFSSAIGFTVAVLANQTRHADIAQSLISSTQDELLPPSRTDPTSRRHSRVPSDMVAVLPSILKQITSQKAYIIYLQERAKSLSTQISALLSREDALASFQIAEKSMKDSSAMKTIAIMTMGFLPATFFAALFAIPSLDWTQPNVIQDTFWVYWAFTVPSTLAIFLIWYLITCTSLFK